MPRLRRSLVPPLVPTSHRQGSIIEAATTSPPLKTSKTSEAVLAQLTDRGPSARSCAFSGQSPPRWDLLRDSLAGPRSRQATVPHDKQVRVVLFVFCCMSSAYCTACDCVIRTSLPCCVDTVLRGCSSLDVRFSARLLTARDPTRGSPTTGERHEQDDTRIHDRQAGQRP